MKILYTLLMLAGFLSGQAQKKTFTASCPDLKQKLQLIKQSFTDLGKFKKGSPDNRGYYATTITLCGAAGRLEIGNNYKELRFEFPHDDFMLPNDDDKIVEAFVQNFRKAVETVFGSSFEETNDTNDDEFWGKSKSCTFRPYTSSYPCITIEFPFADNYVQINFEYEKE